MSYLILIGQGKGDVTIRFYEWKRWERDWAASGGHWDVKFTDESPIVVPSTGQVQPSISRERWNKSNLYDEVIGGRLKIEEPGAATKERDPRRGPLRNGT